MAQRYRVSGPQKVFGVKPGTEFERAIPREHEAQLLAGGHIVRVSSRTSSRPSRRPAARPSPVKAPVTDPPAVAGQAPDPATTEE